MTQGLNIRRFDLSKDYTAVRELWKGAGPGIQVRRSDEKEEIAKKLQRDPDLFLVAENNRQIIGAVLGGFDGRRGMIYHLAVREEYRNGGIGIALMEALEERLRGKGCLRSYLLVTAENNEAMKFYEKRGWQRLELYVYGKDLITKE
ncbi:MAG: GNAT family N-acetyltransferase [Anaerolineales bacterium]|nr:GNAT family N-acetyltransferase [Anaerolineales bacterium]